MANKLVRKSLKHYYDEFTPRSDTPAVPLEPDKSKSISELNQQELRDMVGRLGAERELESIIRELKRNSGERDTYEEPLRVDASTPIDQLYHHGILGMKWGRRRFQNEDGSRTSAGKKRDKSRDRDYEVSDDYKKSREVRRKGTEAFSNDELRKINDRLQLEDSYKRLTTPQITKSKSWVAETIGKAGKDAVGSFSKDLFLGAAKTLVREISPDFAETAGFTKKKKQGE